MKLFLKKDIFIVLGLLLCALLFFYIFSPNGGGMFYEITIDSQKPVKESLYEKKKTVLDCGAIIICDGKSVYFDSSDCPDKVCVNTGALSKDGEWAACLPNRVFLKVTGGDE